MVARYELAEGQGRTVKDSSDKDDPLDLSIDDAKGITWRPGDGLLVDSDKGAAMSQAPTTALVAALQKTNELSIEGVLTPKDTAHTGPARIVSLSKDPAERNFTLGQSGSQYVLRLRTSKTDLQGAPEVLTPTDTLRPERQHVVATFGNGEVCLYVDGRRVSREKREGDFSNWDPNLRFVLANEATLDRQWRGLIEYVAVHNRALNGEEVRQCHRGRELR